MYVCICQQVTDSEIKHAVIQGATRMRDLHCQLGVGACCGKCCKLAKEILEETVAEQQLIDYSMVNFG